VLLAFVVFYLIQGKTHLNGWLVLFPIGVLLEFVAAVGLGLLLAPVTVIVTDTRRVIRIVIRMLFYATPVIYAVDLAEPFDKVLWLNPMTGVLELMRAGFFSHDRFPILWGAIITSAVVSVALLLLGNAVFGRLERPVLKEI
jgi:ABC-2 type transport system permease protein